MKTLTMPNYQRVTVWEADIRATKGDAIVDAAFRKAGLSGNESPTKVKTFVAKFNALRELDPSIELPPTNPRCCQGRRRDASQARIAHSIIGGSERAQAVSIGNTDKASTASKARH